MTFAIDLGGRRALVTGAGQGVGRAVSLALAQAGATVVVNDIVADRAEAVAEEIRGTGGAAETVSFDVTEWQGVSAAIERCGDVDILVNNAGNAGAAGFTAMDPFARSDPKDWERYFAVNLFGVMHCTRAVLPGMIDRQGGRIVTIISDAGRYGDMHLAPYAAAKAGAAGFSRTVAREVGRYNITVNCVSLATIETPAIGASGTTQADEDLAKQLRYYVIRRKGQPDDVAGMVTFLASPLASWITGQTYAVNGGYTFSL
jgi:NAD(P)-dependent dehydrogenase (short-subunit alcohol dehydrogenase family)